MSRGKFIVVDGPDGSGKTTQIELVKDKFTGHSVIYTREPGGIAVAEEIRALLMRDLDSTALTDIFLFFAARFAHLEKKVLPALAAGMHVITDRFDSSTFAYQLWGDNGEIISPQADRMFMAIRQAFPPDWLPDAYIFFDIPGTVARARRMKDNTEAKTRFDIKPAEFYENVRQGYGAFAKRFAMSGPCYNGKNIEVIDANQSRENVQGNLHQTLSCVIAS